MSGRTLVFWAFLIVGCGGSTSDDEGSGGARTTVGGAGGSASAGRGGTGAESTGGAGDTCQPLPCPSNLVWSPERCLCAAPPSGTDCTMDADCHVFEDCCSCEAYGSSGPPASCPADCAALACDERFREAPIARCADGACVLESTTGLCDIEFCPEDPSGAPCCLSSAGPCGIDVGFGCGVPSVADGGAPVGSACELPSDSGPCDAAISMFTYNAASATCEPFIYGGCGGNGNRFETLQQCMLACM